MKAGLRGKKMVWPIENNRSRAQNTDELCVVFKTAHSRFI